MSRRRPLGAKVFRRSNEAITEVEIGGGVIGCNGYTHGCHIGGGSDSLHPEYRFFDYRKWSRDLFAYPGPEFLGFGSRADAGFS